MEYMIFGICYSTLDFINDVKVENVYTGLVKVALSEFFYYRQILVGNIVNIPK